PVFPAEVVFTNRINQLAQLLKDAPATTIAEEIEGFLLDHFLAEREGFLSDLAASLPAGSGPQDLMARTNYSRSTLERYFKKDTGLTPKKFQTLHRFRLAINELYDTGNTDWLHYVEKYGYFDQSHFIKEVKRYTSLTPSKILRRPGLHPYRPKKD
ncbi:MAG: helix-turn-helix domain-containing protein, partial [Bacteroidota bacterium]